ncbi:MAG: DNA methyltransferase [Armatimonadota bacterium]
MTRIPNDLNDLTGTEWIKFTRTWFVCDSPRYWRNKDTELHPARFPEEMVSEFLQFFTKRGGFVLDPFVGSGATLVACSENERIGVGFEVNSDYARVAARRASTDNLTPQVVVQGDARDINYADVWQTGRARLEAFGMTFRRGFPQFDFVITSPPYWSMLGTSRGGVFSKHKQRAASGLDTVYSKRSDDLGNIADYSEFIAALGEVFDGVRKCVKPGKYMVVVAQNLRDPDGEIRPLAWDLARRIGRTWQLQGERIWCQNTKPLGIWGYPKIFVPNYHHHYCLIFRKRPK